MFMPLGSSGLDAMVCYTRGNIIITVLATVATWIVLTILGVPCSLVLGLVVGLFDLRPLIAATLGAIVIPSSSGRGSRTTWSSRSSSDAR
jgi:hypothetical protein